MTAPLLHMIKYSNATLQAAAAAEGNGTVLDLSDMSLGPASHVALQVTGTFVGTVTFEGSVDGTNFAAVHVTDSGGTAAATATAAGIFQADVRGLDKLRARVSAYTSGAITVTARVLWE